MDYYLLLRSGHIVGFILLGGGLLGVFVSELRAHRVSDVHRFAEAAWYAATFYDALVLPVRCWSRCPDFSWSSSSGSASSASPGWSACWGLFLFELVEGNTITRSQFQRTLRRSRAALEVGQLSVLDREQARTTIGRVTHVLDLPLFLVIVYCGAMRPDSWRHILAAIALALVATAILAIIVPKLARPPEAMI